MLEITVLELLLRQLHWGIMFDFVHRQATSIVTFLCIIIIITLDPNHLFRNHGNTLGGGGCAMHHYRK